VPALLVQQALRLCKLRLEHSKEQVELRHTTHGRHSKLSIACRTCFCLYRAAGEREARHAITAWVCIAASRAKAVSCLHWRLGAVWLPAAKHYKLAATMPQRLANSAN
jgi:hypothetical protein